MKPNFHIFPVPSSIECLQLITTNKVRLNSYKSTFVEGRITGSALSAFRPVTHVPVVIEGNNELNQPFIDQGYSCCLHINSSKLYTESNDLQ